MLKNFQTEPIQTIEKLIGVDLPDEKLTPIIAGVKAKMSSEDITSKLKNLF